MSWLKLRRLLPPRKLWKLFSKKFQFKLNKLNRCKAIKKPKIQSHKTTKKLGFPSLSVQPKQFKLKKISTSPHTLKRRHYNCLQERAVPVPPPVYVDQLFIKPFSLTNDSSKEESCSSSSKLKEDEIFYQRTFHPQSCKRSETGGTIDEDKNMNVINSADDLWESLLFGSPQMHGINERAEEFIARFRAEMQNQETLAFNNMDPSP